MWFFLFFLAEIFFLYFLSYKFVSGLYFFLLKFTHSQNISKLSIFIIFLPGVVLHELFHYLSARLLMLKTGRIKLFPENSKNGLILGSVEIQKSDLIRQLSVGLAPFIGGTILLVLLPLYFFPKDPGLFFSFKTAIFLFSVFQIANTMYSSKKDLEGIGKTVLFFVLIIGILYFFKVNIHDSIFEFFSTESVSNVMETASILLLLPISINIFLVLTMRILNGR